MHVNAEHLVDGSWIGINREHWVEGCELRYTATTEERMAEFSRKITSRATEICKEVHMLFDLWERV